MKEQQTLARADRQAERDAQDRERVVKEKEREHREKEGKIERRTD